MAQTLAAFIQTLQACATNPDYSVYLPFTLLEQTLPADPYSVADVQFGDLSSLDPTIPNQLCAALAGSSVASPATAVMTLTNVTFLNGSAAQPVNLSVDGQTVTGTISFDSGTALPGLPAPAPLAIVADIAVALQCCPSNNGSTCSGSPASTPFTATGSTLTFGTAAIDFTLTVDDSFAVTAVALTFSASGLSAAITSSTGAANQVIDTALTGSAGTAAIVAQINSALNSQATLAAIGAKLTPVFQTIAEPTVLSWIIGELYGIANDPTNAHYLPAVLEGSSSPTLEPYQVSGSWSLGDISQFDDNAGALICSGYPAPPGTYMIQSPNTQVPLTLDGVVITGLSNALLKPLLTVGNDIEALVVFGQVPNWPHQFTVSGNFSLQVTCCPTTDGSTCTVSSGASTGTGTFSTAIASASGAGAISIAVVDKKLVATATRIFFRASGLTTSIQITSVPEGQQSVWDDQAEKAFNSQQATNEIVGNIQAQMNSQTVLDDISQMINEALASLTPALLERLTSQVEAHARRTIPS